MKRFIENLLKNNNFLHKTIHSRQKAINTDVFSNRCQNRCVDAKQGISDGEVNLKFIIKNASNLLEAFFISITI